MSKGDELVAAIRAAKRVVLTSDTATFGEAGEVVGFERTGVHRGLRGGCDRVRRRWPALQIHQAPAGLKIAVKRDGAGWPLATLWCQPPEILPARARSMKKALDAQRQYGLTAYEW